MPKKTIKRFFCEGETRALLFLYGGAAFHFLYAAFRLFSGAFFRQDHIDVAAIFYLSLAINRLSIIFAYRKRHTPVKITAALSRSGKLLYVTAGCMLLLIADTIAGARRAPFPHFAVFVSGTYAMISAALAIAELFYLKRLGSPLLSASRAVGLASALLSGFTFLEDLLFSFSPFSEAFRRILLLSVGSFILLLMLFFAVGFAYFNARKHDG